MAQFDEATYETGINWMRFSVRCGDAVAVFRLHMERREDRCWKLMDELAGPKLFPSKECRGTYTQSGENGAKDIGTGKKLEDVGGAIAARFEWLDRLLAGTGELREHFSSSWLDYHGVEFRSHASAADRAHPAPKRAKRPRLFLKTWIPTDLYTSAESISDLVYTLRKAADQLEAMDKDGIAADFKGDRVILSTGDGALAEKHRLEEAE